MGNRKNLKEILIEMIQFCINIIFECAHRLIYFLFFPRVIVLFPVIIQRAIFFPRFWSTWMDRWMIASCAFAAFSPCAVHLTEVTEMK